MSALPMAIPDSARLLAGIEQAKRLLAEARSVDEVKQLRDQAEAMRIYARQAQLGLESQNYAAEIKLRAERRAGELLAETVQHGGDPKSHAVTLADAGVTKMQSSRWQAVARVPEEVFEQHVAATQAKGKELTTVEVVKMARVYQHAHPSPPAETATASPVQTIPPDEPPHGSAGLPGQCPACGADVLIQVWCGVINGKPFHKLFWVPPEKIGQDWYPDDEGDGQ